MRVVLSIAGFDPSGGAGVLADVKTFAAFGCFGAAAVTSLTSQNTLGVWAAYPQTPEVVRAQLEPLAADYRIAAVKIGMLPTAEVIEVVADFITQHGLKNVVVDPVICSSSGYALIDADAVRELKRRLFPLADLITPNADESKLLGATSCNSAAEAARELYAQVNQDANGEARRAVLVKGGHLDGDPTDVLFDGQKVFEFHAERIVTRHTHGTGCALSSAIAARLACGDALPQAVASAKRFVTEAIRTAPGLGQGAGPLNHLHQRINAPTSAVKHG